jgi:hypothetical protein
MVRKNGLKNLLKSIWCYFKTTSIFFLVDPAAAEYTNTSDATISRLFENLEFFTELCALSPRFTLQVRLRTVSTTTDRASCLEVVFRTPPEHY